MDDDISNLLNNLAKNVNSNGKNNFNAESLKHILENFNNSNNTSKNDGSSVPDIDLDTILKIKNIMEKLNSSKSNSGSNLLLALKPFLRESRQSKVDNYIQLLKILPLLESLKNSDSNTRWWS